MTCPIESLDSFLAERWDVNSPCSMMGCPECTAEPGEGALWHLACPPPAGIPDDVAVDYDDILF